MLSLLLGLLAAGHAATITVGSGGDHATIMDAVNAASGGDEIVVSAGTYVEAVSFQGKDLTIRSSGGSLVTTIAPSGPSSAVSIDNGESSAILEGFTLAPTGGGRGLYIQSTSPVMIRTANTVKHIPTKWLISFIMPFAVPWKSPEDGMPL